MGKPPSKRILGSGPSAPGSSSSRTSYRDDPDAVSLHTTPDDYSYADAPGPDDDLPSYSASASDPTVDPSSPQHPEPRDQTTFTDAERAATVSRFHDAYSVHQPGGTNGWRVHRNGKPAECNKTTVRIDERLTDPEELYKYITEYLARVPPHPCVRIHGHHKQTTRERDGKSRTEQVTDFDITMDLQAYLRPAGDARFWGARVVDNGDKVHRGSWRKTRAKGYKQAIQVGGGGSDDADADAESTPANPGLREWCEEYCASPSSLKIFRMNRNVVGLNEAQLRQAIDKLVRETDYLGRIDISFPVEETHVDIYSPHLLNRWRISWVRWLFYLSFLWLLTWPLLFFATRRWDVYDVNWLFSYLDTAAGVVNAEQTTISYPRRYATISEKEWFARHQALLRRMVLMRHQGDATNMALSIENEPRAPAGMGGLNTGNATLDSAAGIMQAGFSAWGAVRNGRVPTQGWGGDC